jgi:hypothetical protein
MDLLNVAGYIEGYVDKPGRGNRRMHWGYEVRTSNGHYDIAAEHLEPALKSDAEAENLIQEALRVGAEMKQERRQRSKWNVWQKDASERLQTWREALFCVSDSEDG